MIAPFPWFGGKHPIADRVWDWLGDVNYYIEPFCGSAAVLLARPEWHRKRHEIVNDKDCHIANFWRAMQAAPDEVASYADWPVNHADLSARHRWLVYSDQAANMARRVRHDPHFYDAKIAGWWVWGLSSWIGMGWCHNTGRVRSGRKIPNITMTCGCAALRLSDQIPHIAKLRGCASRRLSNQIPQLTIDQGVHAKTALIHRFRQLQARLNAVRVCCGDWKRCCSTPSILTHDCGVFLDPPYSAEANREQQIYREEDLSVAHEVREWCIAHQHDCKIVLCGYEGEHNELESQHGWRVHQWTALGGYANMSGGAGGVGFNNRHRERVWISPLCRGAASGLFAAK